MSLPEKRIDSTNNTPEIVLDPAGIIKISGRSMMGEVPDCYYQIEKWIDIYISDPADVTYITIALEYLNMANIVTYISLLKKIESARLKNKKCIINWYYEEGDEDILEKGEYISSFLKTPFNFIENPDPKLN